MWHVSSRSGVATLRTAIHLLQTVRQTDRLLTCLTAASADTDPDGGWDGAGDPDGGWDGGETLMVDGMVRETLMVDGMVGRP